MSESETGSKGETAMRIFVRCRACRARWIEEAEYVDYAKVGIGHSCAFRERYSAKWPTASHHDFAGVWLEARQVDWKPRPGGSLTKCGAKCRSAKGPNCDCRCHGENHGAN